MTASIAALFSLVHVGLSGFPLASLAATAAAKAGTATANPFLWYVTRAAAISAYVTLSATVIMGLVRSLVRVSHVRASWVLDETHQFLAVLTAACVALHLLSLVFDPLIPFSVLNLVVPLDQPYRPIAADLGVLALYGLGIVLLSSGLRRRIAYATWRKLHYTSFAVFLLVTFHGILAGTDASANWMHLVYLGTSLIVALLVLVRVFVSSPEEESGRQGQRGQIPPTRGPRQRSMA